MIAALLWIPVSFFLHSLIHEGAHALEALICGARGVRIWPFPGWRLGRFTWAHMTYSGILGATVAARVSVEPLWAESCWWVSATFLTYSLPHGWWTWILAVEMVSSLVDTTVWLLPWWRTNPNPATDAEKWRLSGTSAALSLKACRLRSLWILPFYAVSVGVILKALL